MKSKQTRLRVLKLAERLENVAEACRQSGVNRASFYGWRKRYLDEGPDGLTVRSPKRRVYPQKSSPQLVHKIRELSLTHPAFGCDRIGPLVSKEGQAISSVSVQKILHTLGLGTRRLRWLALEDQYRQSQNTLSPEQIEFIEQQNPAFRDRSVGRVEPGDLLHADTFLAGACKGGGKVYLHAVIDGCSGFAIGALAPTIDPEIAIGLLETDVVPLLLASQIKIKTVLTGSGREYSGPGRHPYQRYLASRSITQTIVSGSDRHSGTMERFRRTVAHALLGPALAKDGQQGLEVLASKLAAWLRHYNTGMAQDGFPNYGKTPAEMAQISVSIEA